MALVEWAWLRAGAQVTMPVNLLIRTPFGASTIAKLKRLVGISGSVTTFVTFSGRRTWATKLLKGAKTGGLLPLTTETLKVCIALKLEAFSVTITLIVLVTGTETS